MTLFSRNIGSGLQRLVFLHGLLGQGKNFANIAKNLSDMATTTLVDLPDHGRSDWSNAVRYDNYVALVTEKLIELGAGEKPINLVGHSLGGRVAMLTALAHPELIARLGILDMAPGEKMHVQLYRGYMEQMMSIDLRKLHTRQEADDALAKTIPDAYIRQFLLQNLHRDPKSATGWRWLPNLALLHDQLDNLNQWPVLETDRYLGPAEFIAAGKSNYITRRDLPKIHRLFPYVGFEVVVKAGHWVHAEAPENVTYAMRRLLKRPVWR